MSINDITENETRLRSRHTASRSHHHHLYKICEKKRLRLRIIAFCLGGLLAIFSLFWILASFGQASYDGELLAAKSNAFEKQKRLEKLQSEIEVLKQERAQLVQGRIPRLLPVELDVTIPLNQDYIRNISLTLAGISQNRYLEYRVVMQNEGSVRIEPNGSLLLFDELGIQVAKAPLSDENAESDAVSSMLRPGETRSYFNRIKLDQEPYPEYFLVEVQ